MNRPFFERQALYEIKKEANLKAKLSPSQASVLSASKASKRLAKSAKSEVLNAGQSKLSHANPECVFRPQITKLAKSLKSRSDTERAQGNSDKLLEQLRKMKAVTARLQREQTKSLKVLALNNAQSKLQIVSHPETYIRPVEEQATEKAALTSTTRAELCRQEVEGCTFMPKVLSYPHYLRDIA